MEEEEEGGREEEAVAEAVFREEEGKDEAREEDVDVGAVADVAAG